MSHNQTSERTITPEDIRNTFEKCDHCGTIYTKDGVHVCSNHFKNDIREIGDFQADTEQGKAIRRALDPGIPGEMDATVVLPEGRGTGLAFHRPKRDGNGRIKTDDDGNPLPSCPSTLKKKTGGRHKSVRNGSTDHWNESTRRQAYRRWHFPCALCFDLNRRFTTALRSGETIDDLVDRGDDRWHAHIAPE